MLYCRLNNFEASIFSQSVKTFYNKVLDINNNKLLKAMSFYVVLTLTRSNKYLFFIIAREFIICIRNYLSTLVPNTARAKVQKGAWAFHNGEMTESENLFLDNWRGYGSRVGNHR